jgi:hypothetical protein
MSVRRGMGWSPPSIEYRQSILAGVTERLSMRCDHPLAELSPCIIKKP